MKTVKFLLITLAVGSMAFMTSCSKVDGCTNSKANNYDSAATDDDGSCECASTITFSNYDNEDYTIVSSSGSSFYIAAYGTKAIDLTGVENCYTYQVRDGGSSGTLKGTYTHCACDASLTQNLNY